MTPVTTYGVYHSVYGRRVNKSIAQYYTKYIWCYRCANQILAFFLQIDICVVLDDFSVSSENENDLLVGKYENVVFNLTNDFKNMHSIT